MMRLTSVAALALLLTLPTSLVLHAQEAADPFMGDWQGTLRTAGGAETPLCAQVICLGGEGYQANLLPIFDQRVAAWAVLRGKAEGEAVAFEGGARIEGGAFTGELTGEHAGAFTLEPVVRLSPTFDAPPPDGAIVLFDGTNLDEWRGGGAEPFMVDLSRNPGGDDRAAYLRCRVLAPAAQPARLDLGSDDGVKVWLNGELVHANNANRPCRAFDDHVDIDLTEGENTLLLKVVQGGGGWGACARIVARDGADIEGLVFDPEPSLEAGVELSAVQGGSSGTIVTWELAGPYTQEGKRDGELFDVPFAPEDPTAEFDVPFAPEDPTAEVAWELVNDRPEAKNQWELVEEEAMEVTPGSGSLVTKRTFGDHTLHLEFRTPFEPDARGQGRGNSGMYLQGRYEVQVLDSYGLEGRDNECGGMYSVKAPDVNMCAPPLQWQTYDVEFQAERVNAAGERQNPRMTVLHNGVLIHNDVEITVPFTPGGLGEAGGLLLQDHGNRLRYRNIWVVEH